MSNIKVNNKTKLHKRQSLLAYLFPLRKDIARCPLVYFESLSVLQRQLLNKFIFFTKGCRSIYPSQITLAKNLNCSRKHINKMIKKFVSAGVIAKKQRWNNSCLYKVNSFFSLPDIKQKLSKLLPALMALPLGLLLSLSAEVTLSKYKAIRNYSSYKSHPQKGRVMDASEFIPAYIQRLEFPRCVLTRWGKIKLCAFNQQTIEYACSILKERSNVHDPYNYFFKLCLDYADLYQFPLDFSYVAQLGNKFGEKSTNPTNEPYKEKRVTTAFTPQKENKNGKERYLSPERGVYAPWKGFPERKIVKKDVRLNQQGVTFLAGLGQKCKKEIISYMLPEKNRDTSPIDNL